MLTSVLSGGGEVPGASSLFSARNRQKSSHPSPVTLCSAGSGPTLNPPPSVARENASQPKPLPGAGHRAAGLATAPQEAPDPRGATISWTRVPMSYLPLLGKRHYLYYLGIQSKISRRTDIFIFITRNVLVNGKSSCLLSCNVNKFDPERVLVSTFPVMPY